jgi:hypothetical protein
MLLLTVVVCLGLVPITCGGDGAPAEPSKITAFSPSPEGGDPVASASVDVAFGEAKLLEGTTWVLSEVS